MADEPTITINGQMLTKGQAMAVRVAITNFHDDMHKADTLGKDEHGLAMTKAYRERLTEVITIILR